ncbi:MAG: magnesium and cobalt exporter, family [Acidimicrobiaceae bacterium]|jgi:CBS domain containing-hemolysin-like protein
MSVWSLVLAVILLVANGVFVAMEFSTIASRRTKLEALADQGDARARMALEASGELPLQLAGAQLGVTMCSLGLGAVAEPTVAGAIEWLLDRPGALPEGLVAAVGLSVGLAIVVFFHMVIGEMVPKYVAMADPERMLLRLAIFNRIYVTLFRPVIRLLNAAANAGTRLFGVEPRDEIATAHTAPELADMLAASREGGMIGGVAHDLLSGALDFGARSAVEVMVPRERLTTVSRSATVADAEAVIVTSGHSRLLVTGDDGQDIIGFIHAKDLLTVPTWARDRAIPQGRIRRVLEVSASRHIDDVLVDMRRSRTHLGVVVDESHETLGLITLEDVLEELVGEIRDESDRTARRRRVP